MMKYSILIDSQSSNPFPSVKKQGNNIRMIKIRIYQSRAINLACMPWLGYIEVSILIYSMEKLHKPESFPNLKIGIHMVPMLYIQFSRVTQITSNILILRTSSNNFSKSKIFPKIFNSLLLPPLSKDYKISRLVMPPNIQKESFNLPLCLNKSVLESRSLDPGIFRDSQSR